MTKDIIKGDFSALIEDQKDWENQFDEGFFHYLKTDDESRLRNHQSRGKNNPITIKFQINDFEYEVKIQTEWKDMSGNEVIEFQRYLWFEILDQNHNLNAETISLLQNHIINILEYNFGSNTFDKQNFPVEYGASRSFSYDSNKKWSFSFSVKTAISRESQKIIRNFSSATQMLLNAIRERDEKIAAEEARKKAEEEKELALKKAEEERVRLENEKNLQEYELVKKFVDEIGDFEVKVPSEEGDGTFTYMPIREVIDFEDDLSVKFNYYMNFDCDDSTSFSLKKHGYEEAKKIIIDWAVHYGARKPELVS